MWTVEFQLRGAPHFHVWMNKRFNDCPEWEDNGGSESWRPLMKNWLRISKQESDEEAVKFNMHQAVYTDWDVHAGKAYATKYASKMLQKGLPSGVERFGRWWGCSYDLKLAVDERETREGDYIWRNGERYYSEPMQFRRQVKRFIEKKFDYKFPRDKEGSLRSIRWEMKEEYVACCNRLADYYIPKLHAPGPNT